MRIPWLSLAFGLLIYLVTGSLVASVAAFIVIQICLGAFFLALAKERTK